MKKIVLVSLLTLFNTYSADTSVLLKILQDHVSQKELNKAAAQSVRLREQSSIDILLEAGAHPPLFTAAKSGHRTIAKKVAVKASKQRLSLSEKKRKKILKRLILTGDKTNLHLYFKSNVLTSFDVTKKRIAYAEERAKINPGNKHILTYLRRQYRKRKQQEKLKKEIKFDQKECAICLDDFKARDIKALPCDHVFHPFCCNDWFKSLTFEQCPTCKQPERDNQGIPAAWMQWIYD